LVTTKSNKENKYCDRKDSTPSCLNNGIGFCHNSYYSLLDLKDIYTRMGISPKYDTIRHNRVEIGKIDHSQYFGGRKKH
jgi:hypothetical protein